MYDNWTKEQKLAVLRILMDIAAADNFIDVSEINFILETSKDFGLHRSVVLSILQTTSVRKALSHLSVMEEHDKIEVANLMRRLIDIDGQVDKNEIKIFTIVMNEMGFEILG